MKPDPLLRQIAHWCVNLRLDDVPDEVTHVAKTALTDYVAVTIAGSEMPVARKLQQFAMQRAPQGNCSVFGTEQKTSMAYASYANGAASHALDFDDVSWATIGHPTVTVAPVAFAAAEEGKLGGESVLLAYIAGVEAQHQIAKWVMPQLSEQGWHTTPAIGVFGATVAAGLLQGLDETALTNALAIAASSASGVRGNFGSQTKAMHAGMAAFNGVNAVELAMLGVTGKPNVIEAADGFAQCFTGISSLEGVEVTLGRQWDLLENGLVFKQYPCCSGSHPAIDCWDALIVERGLVERGLVGKELGERVLDPDDIEYIQVGASLLGPRELVCDHPQNVIEAKFSMQYALAARLIHGAVGLDQFTDEAVRDPRVQALMSKIRMRVDPELEKLGFIGTAPVKIRVYLANGETLSIENDLAKGTPEKPLSQAEIEKKFTSCVVPRVGEHKCQHWLSALANLEAMTFSELNQLLNS
ncbi:MmgE/PrpD family protein [Photobacterium chitinilyticum]|uniref:MmgE/PrpD family protein n=1 Tax=Photobacterium chitinilyticum TaxID=2485123 RepID=A0A444JT62_9GAMM|nr:MmgE/PrpD family protein [Photobacterium chitinilyticum]RWX56246.1 MmgE/PrpD family protein [Photobacterium chitinilyticum]